MRINCQSIVQFLKYVGGCIILLSIFYLAFVLGGWIGLLILLAIPVSFILFLLFIVYGFRSAFVYTDKDVGQEIKGFLGYDFGNKYEIITNETRVHGDRPVRFVIRIPKEAMVGVRNYCKSSNDGECTEELYTKNVVHECRREEMKILFNECLIEFSGVSF